jgi:hypothetical protein
MWEMKNAYKVLGRNPDGTENLGSLVIEGEAAH